MIKWFKVYFISSTYAQDISKQRCITNRERPCMIDLFKTVTACAHYGSTFYNGDINTWDNKITNISNALECQRECQKLDNCSVWTHAGDECVVFSQSMSRWRSNTDRPGRTCGPKYCDGSWQPGKLVAHACT